jgi:uncharacterized membrane protein YhaH (DUF805 family)
MKYYLDALKKYAQFEGRATKKEFWMFVLFNIIISIIIGIIGNILGLDKGDQNILSNTYNLAIFLPSIAIAVRRLHDTNSSGWWVLFPIVNIIMCIQEGTLGENKYGPSTIQTLNENYIPSSQNQSTESVENKILKIRKFRTIFITVLVIAITVLVLIFIKQSYTLSKKLNFDLGYADYFMWFVFVAIYLYFIAILGITLLQKLQKKLLLQIIKSYSQALKLIYIELGLSILSIIFLALLWMSSLAGGSKFLEIIVFVSPLISIIVSFIIISLSFKTFREYMQSN